MIRLARMLQQEVPKIPSGLLLALAITCWSCASSTSPNQRSGSSLDTDRDALSLPQVRISAATVVGIWESFHFIGANDKDTWTGSAGVVAATNGTLHLVTNSHCLNLVGLAQSPRSGRVGVVDFKLMIIFSNGMKKEVLRFADHVGDKDLAYLEIDAAGLTEGQDYVILPYKAVALNVGDEVVAVGSPMGIPRTVTFGRISDLKRVGSCTYVQTDAAVNHGNSGGPLFLKKRQDQYLWVGVNTLGFAPGVNFAIHPNEAFSSDFRWYTANKAGVVKALEELYRVGALER